MLLGTLYRQSGKMQKALDCLNEACPSNRMRATKIAQAMTLNALGRVYTDLGQEDKALDAVQPGACLCGDRWGFSRAKPAR